MVFAVLSIVKFVPFVFIRSIVICLSADGHHITPYTLLSESAGLFTSMTLFVDKIASGKGILHHVDAGHLAVMSIYSGNLPFKREQAESFPRLSAKIMKMFTYRLLVFYHIINTASID